METVSVFFGDLEFTLNRVAFTLFGVPIYWYGVLIALGFVCALVYGFMRASHFGIETDPLIDVILVTALFSIVGARLYYVLNTLDKIWTLPEIIDIRDGGLGFYGALIATVIVGFVMCKIRKVDVLSAFDLAGISYLVAQSIGRWGNFVNQEAFGTSTNLPFGMFSAETHAYMSDYAAAHPELNIDPYSPVHPCFLYESIWCMIGFVLIHFLSKKRVFRGEVFLYYITWYGLGRFFIEGLRTDSLMLFDTNIRISQLVAAVCVFVGIVLIIVFRKRAKNRPVVQLVAAGEQASDDGYTSMIIDDDAPEAWADDQND